MSTSLLLSGACRDIAGSESGSSLHDSPRIANKCALWIAEHPVRARGLRPPSRGRSVGAPGYGAGLLGRPGARTDGVETTEASERMETAVRRSSRKASIAAASRWGWGTCLIPDWVPTLRSEPPWARTPHLRPSNIHCTP